MHRCLYCYEPLDTTDDFHEHCSRTFFGTVVPPVIPYSSQQMAELAKQVVERSITIPGVQPKLSMSMVEDALDRTAHRLTVVGALGGSYILKPPSTSYPEMPENEHVTMRMAEAFGIRVVPSSLIRLASGELSYITRRIDRTDNGTVLHMLDMFQITEAFDKYKSSMEKIGKVLQQHSENTQLDKIFFFEIAVFCFLTGNNDMHLKNFSMIESAAGWVLAPAYDLLNVTIANPKDTEEMALSLEGKKRHLRRTHFEQFGKNLGLNDKQIQGVFNRMILNKPKASAWISRSFLSDTLQANYLSLLETRYQKLSL
jgi:serine/threonine-protein kinase HipA